jgi:hypothetical protein
VRKKEKRKVAEVLNQNGSGGDRRNPSRIDDGTRGRLKRVSRPRRLGVIATFVAAIVVASPVAASARDDSNGVSGPAHKAAVSSKGLQHPARDKKRPSRDGGGGGQSDAAWGS